MKPSRSRSRSKNTRNRSPQGGNVVNRVFDSSGPEGKVRGTPQQIIDKYNQLARDAQLSNDRVAAENFQQHAEHYLRLLSEAQREIDARREEQDRQNRERQAERDRERAARQDAASSAHGPSGDTGDGGTGPQPDVVARDVSDDDVDSGLVETPEDRPRERRRTRKPAAEARDPDANGTADETASDQPAAEPPTKPARGRPRKPRAKKSDPAPADVGSGDETPAGDGSSTGSDQTAGPEDTSRAAAE